MKKFLSVLLAAIIICCISVPAFSAGPDTELRFKNGKFTILHISDPQDDRYPAYDLANFLKLAIETAKPDLVVFTGDVVEDSRGADTGIDEEDTREGVSVYDSDGNLIYDQTLENTVIAADNVFSVINDAGIPFVTAQGNNDYKSGVTNDDWLKIYGKYEYCITKDESEGLDRIDCHTEIKDSSGKTVFNLWLMDTGTKKVSDDSVKWYKKTSSKLKDANGGNPVPSIVFQHIFVKEIGNLFKVCNIWDDGAVCKDGIFYRLNRNKATGHFTCVSAAPGGISDEFRAWRSQGDVLGAYFGHEHTEGYTGKYKGIDLGFTYGCEFSKSGPYGFRVITLNENDINNYKNELYVYTGSVKTGDAGISLQQDESYPTYSNNKEKLAQYFENFKINIKLWFEEVFG